VKWGLLLPGWVKHVGYIVPWYQLEGRWKSCGHFNRDAPVFSAMNVKSITVKTSAGLSSTFKLVPENCVSITEDNAM